MPDDQDQDPNQNQNSWWPIVDYVAILSHPDVVLRPVVLAPHPDDPDDPN